ncbi:MAG TPA: c-type cytochrome, partial [Anaerolineales bacterium]|nr:c-type cytochrome [Anaerolineales bacterium]
MKSKRSNWPQAGAVVALLLLAPIGASQADADSALIQQGQALYQANCVFCHQADAIGKAGFAPSLTNSELLSMASDKFFMGTIR